MIEEPSSRAADLIDFVARIAAASVALWAVVEKVWKPTVEWRRRMSDERKKTLAVEIREILKPELDRLIIVASCNERLDIVLRRQDALFSDIDAFLSIAGDNKERHDEMNDLMDALGFTSADRRQDDEKRARTAEMLREIRNRQTLRRRAAAAERAERATPVDEEGR